MNKYFTFDDENRSIRIHRFDTPCPWLNYLSNGRLHAFVSNAGGGFAWWKSPVIMRLTRYRQYNLPLDTPGFYVYIREADGICWSPTMRPCETALDSFEARHRPGWSEFAASKNGVEAALSYFIPPDYDAIVWDLKLTNRRTERVSLDIFPYTEFSQFEFEREVLWGYYVKLMLRTWFDAGAETLNYLFHAQGSPREDEVPLVYLSSTHPVISYSGDRDDFIGDYRSERNPVSIERNNCGNSLIECGQPAAALQNHVELAAGESVTVRYFLGAVPGIMRDFDGTIAVQREVIGRLRTPGVIEEQKDKMQRWWDEHFDVMQCGIPDVPAQRQINIWNPINSVVTGRYSRSVNTWAPGIRGVGYRDTCQDMLAIAYRRPKWAADTMKYLMSQQFADGHATHTSYPEERKPSVPATTMHSDDHLWLPLLANAILAETGDYSLLEDQVPYLTDDGAGETGGASVWEHLMQAVEFTETHRGIHALPLTLKSDWNDIIGRFAKKGRGETVFAGQQYVLALRYLIEIAQASGKTDDRAKLVDCCKRMENALLACAWDGAWWLRAFDDDAVPVGSNQCAEGKLFLNPQSWAVLSGVGSREQLVAGMDSAARILDTGIGLKLLHPSFSSWEGESTAKLRGYAPGCGENGAIFCHANTWAVIAEALLGRAGNAWKYFTQLLPANAFEKVGATRYRAEPYAWVSNIVGPDNNRFGWANVEQISGTAPWMDVAATQYLLGVRPQISGLRIDPCIPADWKEITITRHYRGCMLDIRIKNPRGVQKGIVSLTVDGKAVDMGNGPILPPTVMHGKKSVSVEALMG